MKKIVTLLSLFALISGFMSVNAQTPPASISVDGVELLDNPVYFNGGAVMETTYFFESAALPMIVATPADGQTLLVTQPADTNKVVGQVVVCDDKGTLLPNSAYTIRFMRKYEKSKVIGSCDITYELNGADQIYTFTFNDPQAILEQVVEPFPSGAVLKDIGNFMDAQETPAPISAATIAKTAFFDGGKAYVKVDETGVVYTLNFSILENTNTAPADFNLTLKDGTPLYVDPSQFSTTDGGAHYVYDGVLDQQIKRTDVTPADATQSVVFLYQSYDSVAVRIQAENGDTAIYSFVYGKALDPSLEVTVSVEDTKISGTRVANFSPSNRVVEMVVKDNVSDFPIAQYDVKSAKEKKQTVFVSSRPDKNQSIIYVKAENGDTISYVINYVSGDKRNSVELEDITVAGNSFIFDKEKNEFTVNKRGKIDYVKESQFSNVTILDSDTGAVIIVTSEDGSDHKEYYIHYKSGATTPEVKKVYYDGVELTGDPMLYTYPGLDALKLFSADITGDRYFVLQQGSELPDKDVIIRAFSGEAFADNTIDIVADRAKSGKADLDSLYFFDGTDWVDVTDQLTAATIEIPLANYKSPIPPMTVVADRYANVTITYAKASTEQSIIHVEAEDGLNTRDYAVNYTIPDDKSSNNDLTILVDGVSVDISQPIPYVPGSKPVVSWIRGDKNQLLSVESYDVGGTSKIVDTAEDGTSKEYKFSFIPSSGGEKYLKSITINGSTIATTEVTAPVNSVQEITSGYSTTITDKLDIEFLQSYGSQPVMITNFRNFTDYEGNLQSSIIDVDPQGQISGAQPQMYLIPVTAANPMTPSDIDETSNDINIFIDGFVPGATKLNGDKDFNSTSLLDSTINHDFEKYNLMDGSEIRLKQRFEVPYDWTGRWPAIEVQTTKKGQYVTINAVTDKTKGWRGYTIYVYSEQTVRTEGGFKKLDNTNADRTFEFSFEPVGTSDVSTLSDIMVNGNSLIGTTDFNGLSFDQSDGITYIYYNFKNSLGENVISSDSVPLITFEKAADGQIVNYVVTRDITNLWKYNVKVVVESADLSNTRTYYLELYQYSCNDGKFESLGVLNESTFDPDVADYTAELKSTAWPKLTFVRSTPYDGVKEVLTPSKADFESDC